MACSAPLARRPRPVCSPRPLAAARARVMRPPGCSAEAEQQKPPPAAPPPGARLHASLPLRQMGSRGGRRMPSSGHRPSQPPNPIPPGLPTAFALLRPANIMPPKADMVRVDAPYWHRLVRPPPQLVSCLALAVAVPSSLAPCRMAPRDLLAAQVRDAVAIPTTSTASGTRPSPPRHKGETQSVHG